VTDEHIVEMLRTGETFCAHPGISVTEDRSSALFVAKCQSCGSYSEGFVFPWDASERLRSQARANIKRYNELKLAREKEYEKQAVRFYSSLAEIFKPEYLTNIVKDGMSYKQQLNEYLDQMPNWTPFKFSYPPVFVPTKEPDMSLNQESNAQCQTVASKLAPSAEFDRGYKQGVIDATDPENLTGKFTTPGGTPMVEVFSTLRRQLLTKKVTKYVNLFKNPITGKPELTDVIHASLEEADRGCRDLTGKEAFFYLGTFSYQVEETL
jgi:hypothetical protein